MSDNDEFSRFLKRMGKKQHVVEGLVKRLGHFEAFIGDMSLEDVGEDEIMAYAESLNNDKSALKQNLRAVALYYKFAERPELGKLASNTREREISKTRDTGLRIKDIMGIDQGHASILAKYGIKTGPQLLEKGRTSGDRKKLAALTGIPLKNIEEYVNISDIGRIWAVKGIRARLYHDAGLDVERLADAESDLLYRILQEWVKETGFNGIAPLKKQLEFTIKEARKLEPVVEF